MMKMPFTKRSRICWRQKDAPSSRVSAFLTWISLAISLIAAAFTGWQALVAKQALNISEQANSISQENVKIVEKQLKRASIEEEIKRLETINTTLSAGYLSVLNMDLSKLNFEVSKKILIGHGKSPVEQENMSRLLDAYWQYFTSIATITPSLMRAPESYKALSTMSKNISQLSDPDEIRKWNSEQCRQFLHQMLNNLNTINAIFQNNFNDNQKKITTLREQLQSL